MSTLTDEYLVEFQALDAARAAHAGQVRKYTGEPYVWHCIAVAVKLRQHGYKGNVIAAALMHDVLEDTDITEGMMRKVFGNEITDLVLEVTDVSKPEDGNRAVRKQIDREHLAKASDLGKAIKLADLIDNTASIVKHDQNFAKKYIAEKEALLEVLKLDASPLYYEAVRVLSEARLQLEHKSLILVSVHTSDGLVFGGSAEFEDITSFEKHVGALKNALSHTLNKGK